MESSEESSSNEENVSENEVCSAEITNLIMPSVQQNVYVVSINIFVFLN